MTYTRIMYSTILFVGLTGCSTAPITPSIETFGEAVSTIVAADAATPNAKSLKERVNAQRRNDFAAARVVYSTSDRGGCDYVRPDLSTGYFDQVCQIVPMKLDTSTDELVTVASVFDPGTVQQQAEQVMGTSNTALLKEQLASLLKQDLLRYGQEIAALSTATEPAEIGTSAAAAYVAFTGLGDAITRSEEVTKSDVTQRRATRSTFISTVLAEALETYRYRLLKRIVGDADAYVRQAAIQLAILEFEIERADLDLKNQDFLGEIDEQAVGSSAGLKQIEDRFANMAAADRKASFRRYTEIGTAHGAIVEALRSPGDLERLAEATSRIRVLVDAVSALN